MLQDGTQVTRIIYFAVFWEPKNCDAETILCYGDRVIEVGTPKGSANAHLGNPRGWLRSARRGAFHAGTKAGFRVRPEGHARKAVEFVLSKVEDSYTRGSCGSLSKMHYVR